MKRIVFLIIATLLVIGLVLPGAVLAQGPIPIKVIIAGPMAYAQGQDMMNGAELAATEIGTFSTGGNDYEFELIECDTNEISDSAAAGAKLEAKLLANTDCKIVAGGFRTEGVNTEIPVILDQTALFMIVGAATPALLAPVAFYEADPGTYGDYKYIFRASPFNASFLVNNILMMMQVVSANIRSAMGWPAWNGTNQAVRIGIFAESLEWAAPLVYGFQVYISIFGALFGWEQGLVETCSDTAGSSIVVPKLNALAADECHVILTIVSGPVGTIFSSKKGELEIPALAVGINVLGQESTFWEDTEGYCESDILMGSWAPGVAQTGNTLAFLAAFEAAYGKFPSYTAATYDVLYNLEAAIVSEGWDSTNDGTIQTSVDNLIPYFEDLNNKITGTSGVNAFYPKWDMSTLQYSAAFAASTPNNVGFGVGILPALNTTQLDALYGVNGYDPSPGHNYTMPSFTTHDLVYGTDWVTGIFVQWRAS